MKKIPIKFGTDGWRAIIADQYTFANLEKVAAATSQWLKAQSDAPAVVIGYDTRFLGEHFAQRTAEVLASMGIRAIVSKGFTTTPIVSWTTLKQRLQAGIVITASHNPPEYNGFKIKAHYGGPADPEQIAEVEGILAQIYEQPVTYQPWEALEAEGQVQQVDLATPYLAYLREKLYIDRIATSNLRIAYDAMFGAGQGLVTRLLGKEKVFEIRHDHNPGFHGQAPEPIERHLQPLREAVLTHHCDLGMATDGDADRIGLFDEEGRFVDSHKILALLVKYLVEQKGLRGTIVRTFSTTDMLARMAERYGLPIETTPIGFKYIAPKMITGKVLVGGEESGGIAVMGHIPERDGIYIGLLIAEIMVERQKKLSELVQELFDEFGPHYFYREDLHMTEEVKQRIMQRLQEEGLQHVAGEPVVSVETLDGIKFRTPSGWVLVRPSGTEPVLRVYAESTTLEKARAMVQEIAGMIATEMEASA